MFNSLKHAKVAILLLCLLAASILLIAMPDSIVESDNDTVSEVVVPSQEGASTTASDPDPVEVERQAEIVPTWKADTTSSGAFTYNVPIELPPGVAGFAPTVSLSYNSSSKSNSIVGVGWHIGTESCIQRVAPPRADMSGHMLYGRGSPTFTAADGYQLDGEPLIKCPAGGTAACPNGTYRTQHDNFSLIERATIAGVDGWRVTDPTGEVLEYGDPRASTLAPSFPIAAVCIPCVYVKFSQGSGDCVEIIPDILTCFHHGKYIASHISHISQRVVKQVSIHERLPVMQNQPCVIQILYIVKSKVDGFPAVKVILIREAKTFHLVIIHQKRSNITFRARGSEQPTIFSAKEKTTGGRLVNTFIVTNLAGQQLHITHAMCLQCLIFHCDRKTMIRY